MNKSKKAQMEMMGLAVIVILLALGMYFMTKFTLLSGDAQKNINEKDSEIATSFLNTFISVQANCSSPITFGTLVDEMTTAYSGVYCGEEGPDVHFRKSAESILNQTIGKWYTNKKYEFSLDFPPNAGLNRIVIGSCANMFNIEASSPFPIPSRSGGNSILKLKICS